MSLDLIISFPSLMVYGFLTKCKVPIPLGPFYLFSLFFCQHVLFAIRWYNSAVGSHLVECNANKYNQIIKKCQEVYYLQQVWRVLELFAKKSSL